MLRAMPFRWIWLVPPEIVGGTYETGGGAGVLSFGSVSVSTGGPSTAPQFPEPGTAGPLARYPSTGIPAGERPGGYLARGDAPVSVRTSGIASPRTRRCGRWG